MSEHEQHNIADGARAASGWGRMLLIVGTVAACGVLSVAAQLTLVAGRLNAGTLDPAFCSPRALHTTIELPETQLARDFVAIRILLKDPSDNFDTIRKLYEGELQAPDLRRTTAWLSKRTGRGQLQVSTAPVSTLKSEAARIDANQRSALEKRIADGLSRRDSGWVESALRDMFAVLIDELLTSVGRQFGDPTMASRTFPHARRYYAEALDAHLTLNHPAAAARANTSLAAMARAVEVAATDSEAARVWFDRERLVFVGAVKAAIGDQRRSVL